MRSEAATLYLLAGWSAGLTWFHKDGDARASLFHRYYNYDAVKHVYTAVLIRRCI